ncbi:MAG: hypothetical protein ACYC8T_27970 [Myxococcaceae bacterium]
MMPRRILALSALLLSGLFAALLLAQGQTLPVDQLQGLGLAALMAGFGAVLVAQAATFASAARWYIALLAVGLLGAFAASVAREQAGDALGLVASCAAALACAAGLVRRSTGRGEEDGFVASQRAAPALRRLVGRIEAESLAVLVELPKTHGSVRGRLVERLDQLAGQLEYAAGWSDRLGIGARDPVRRKLTVVHKRIERNRPRRGC